MEWGHGDNGMNANFMNNEGCTDLLRLSPNELRRLTEVAKQARADATSSGTVAQAVDRRKASRLHLGNAVRLVCETRRSDDRPVKHMVKCFDISSTGIGFLHGAFIHPGTSVVLTMLSHEDAGFRMRGNIVRSRHLTRHVHEVGVKFDAPIDICAMLEMLGLDPSLADECIAKIAT